MRGVQAGVRNVAADGTLQIPGGICGRIVPGGATALPFPIIGYFDDGSQTPLVFMDTGATPLITDKVDGARGFPVIFLTGLTPGLAVAFLVAKTPEAAQYVAAGGLQIATDSSGRIVVVGPDAVGVPATGNPVVMGVVDSVTGAVRRAFSSGTAGVLAVHPTDAGATSVVGTPGAGAPSRAIQVMGRAFAGLKVFPLNLVAYGAGAPQTVWTPAAGKKFRLMGALLVSSVAQNILLGDNTAGVGLFAIVPSPAGGAGVPLPLGPDGYLSSAINQVLVLQVPGAANLSGVLWGTEE